MTEGSEQILISWSALEFEKQEKGLLWFILFGVIALLFFAISLLMKNYVFSLMILMASFLVFVHAIRHPHKIKTTILESSILINHNIEIPFKEIISFWIFEEPHLRSLHLKTKKITRPEIQLPLGNQAPKEIREILSKFIKEKKQEESLIDVIAKWLNF
jgi:hypothetical protein